VQRGPRLLGRSGGAPDVSRRELCGGPGTAPAPAREGAARAGRGVRPRVRGATDPEVSAEPPARRERRPRGLRFLRYHRLVAPLPVNLQANWNEAAPAAARHGVAGTGTPS